ncbi:lanosterol synthase Erg7p [Trichomonascus vanleenenianus]|uniref:lanosterol synthase ERG7 n=1 Tax=Trichomonascus vanleenenianus TaxID=2268995 RepID=UPI003ECB6A35
MKVGDGFVLPSERYGLPRTDPSRWRLVTDDLGKQNWVYIREGDDHLEKYPPSNFTSFQLGLETFDPGETPKAETPFEAAVKCMRFLKYIQDPCGTFPCQYSGPMFMLVGYIVAKYFCKVPYSEEEKIEISRYLINRAHPVDGGWGLHTYDKSTAFGTTINYLILRLLGMERDHPAIVKARKTLHRLGGAIGNPHWGKAYLAMLNLYDWDGVNPAPPELWMLPYAVPFHPGRWWVHTRAIYLPLGYLSSTRAKAELDPLLKELREELYTVPYDSIDFSKHRNTVCGVDLYYPHSKLLDIANWGLVKYEKYIRPNWLLKKANKYAFELILKDLENTDYLAIAPVSNVMSAMCVYLEKGSNSPEFQRFLYRWPDFLFMSEEGMMMNGTNGVQVWDCAFALQYCVVAGLAELPEFKDAIVKGYQFLLRSQFVEDCVEGSFRDHRNGAWPFSTQTQGFTVSDCTAEAIKAIIMVQNVPGLEFLKDEISEQRLRDGIDVLLSLQNTDNFHYGSFASYERIKGPEIVEQLNPAEVFGNIMIEYPYVECTDSSVLGLVYFRKYFDYRSKDIDHAVKIALDYIKSFQRQDGSWYGSWGVCFTYATMFAIEALSTQGWTYHSCEEMRKGCDFLASHQEEDGGWCENFRSCEVHSWVRDETSQVVQTSWAVIALLLADYPEKYIIDRGVRYLMDQQNLDGSYDWNHVEGVFNHSCAMEYPNYKFYFPMKAFGMYANRYGRNARV